MRKVAITGGLACGKSSVCHFFAECGAFVINTDKIVHQLLVSTSLIGKKVVELLGADVLVEGEISREEVANKVFNDPFLLRKLEALLHPAVKDVLQQAYEQAQRTKAKFFVVELPLLFESQQNWDMDVTVAVVSDEVLCRQRFRALSGDDITYEARVKRQLSQEEKGRRADYVIENNGSLTELREQVHELANKL